MKHIDPWLELLMSNVYLFFVLFYDIEFCEHRSMIGFK